jgi:cell fate (sporulation/competence/biofilm development) regulator YlbF (YheA/YmcA/DUF963 family)
MPTLESHLHEERLDKIIKEFAQAISESPEFLSFEEARKKLKEDQKAQKLIKEFEDKQQLFQMFGNSSDSQTQAELNKYREKMLTHPQIRDYFQKQGDFTRFFQDLGKLISDVAGFDFGQACAPPTGCC